MSKADYNVYLAEQEQARHEAEALGQEATENKDALHAGEVSIGDMTTEEAAGLYDAIFGTN